MTIELARKAFGSRGARGEIERLATGMSSVAWLSRIGDEQFVVRTPTPDDRRPHPDYAAEAALNHSLRSHGVPATDSQALSIDGVGCSIAPRVIGTPIQPDQWVDAFVADVSAALAATHSVPLAGHLLPEAAARFHLAPIWPLDGSDLDDHPVQAALPGVVDWVCVQREAILHEAAASARIVHSDLHWDHLIRSPQGRLAGLLDFGDAFAGPPAWDLACLRYYHGDDVARRVAARYPDGPDILRRSEMLGIAFGLYKLVKTPQRADVVERVERLVTAGRDG